MNAAHKILTVSYGTFSCTLEGFDDPFNTMKAIAEYFRDLAAEDRYFGAEPPQPDAAMLHKIAEREIQRRVEAKIQDNGVVLRARDSNEAVVADTTAAENVSVKISEAVSEPVSAAVLAAPVAQPQASATIQASATMGTTHLTSGSAPAATQEAAPKAAPRLLAEDAATQAMASAAQRLQRLRAAQAAPVVVHAADVTGAQVKAPAPEAAPEALVTLALAAAPAVAPVHALTPVEPVADITADTTGQITDKIAAEGIAPPLTELAPEAEVIADDIPADMPEVLPEDAQPEDAQPEDALVDAPESAADLAMFTRLAEVATPAHTEALSPADDVLAVAQESAEPETVEPETTGLLPMAEDTDADVLSALRETLAGALDSAEITPEALAAEGQFADADQAPAADDLAAILEQPPVEALTPIQTAEVTLPDLGAYLVPAEADLPEDQPQELPADLTLVLPEDISADLPEDYRAEDLAALPATDEQPEVEALAPAEVVAEVVAETPREGDAQAPLVAEKIQRARARVIKIRRLEPSAPVDSPIAAEEPAATEALTTAPATAPAEDRSAALRSALTEPAPSRLPVAQTDDAAVDRLIQKANSEFEEPQTKRRRSAIAHLKAAVLATVAERRAKGAPKPDDNLRQDPYRKDLDQVMRPATERPAPLVLLPTLRIDQPATAPAAVAVQPVRPRRVTHAATLRPAFSPEEDELAAAEMANVFNETPKQSFQDFADGLGASSLQDLIEAAGAFLTLTRGQDGFTRPELFAQINALGSEPSREDGLRGFGRLLREGRLTRTEAGTYALTEISPMLAQAKRRAS
ncbi:hypothetical protein NX862_01695 [Rhodobacter sp. KR11]|uniref:hypothetical protein n=1 Tax=Rhodobacter sp. KR11 TaxID=2974588 RepID=UPI0022226501|nr:hypothetical protein [Rhodobacter sp. KR11]MCW1917459.1 hypothetical protein [Rhodobacter sp. KR11]